MSTTQATTPLLKDQVLHFGVPMLHVIHSRLYATETKAGSRTLSTDVLHID